MVDYSRKTNPRYSTPSNFFLLTGEQMQYWYHRYVDDKHVDTIKSGWPMIRILRQLEKKYPDAKEWAVYLHDENKSLHKLCGLGDKRTVTTKDRWGDTSVVGGHVTVRLKK